MNPGDLYHDPTQRAYDPYDPQQQQHQQQHQQPNPHGSPPRHPFPAAPYHPSHTPNPYDNPPPQIQHSHSQPFHPDPLQHQGNIGYGDPFRDSGASENQQQWGIGQTGNNHLYPSSSSSYPLLPVSPPPHMPQHPSTSLSPSRPHMALEPARTRFDSNPSFISNPHNSFHSGLVNLPDTRLSSPPPMLQHSSSDLLYPPRPYAMQHSSSISGVGLGMGDEGDVNDSAPLLNHAQVAFGPGSGSGSEAGQGGRGYQLRDEADVGLLPGSIGGGGHQMGPSADEEDVNVHYGPVPTRVVRRNKTQKRVK